MKLNLFFKSADLKNVNWHCGNLQPYAVAWIDHDKKRYTKIDATNGVNPVWNEMITIPLPSNSRVETANLYIDIVHAPSGAIIGSTMLSIRSVVLDETHSEGNASFSLILERPSGRSQGRLEFQIGINNTNIIPWEPAAQPQPQLQPRPQPQPQHQYQPQQMINQYPNVLGPVGPVYAVNSPQNFAPILPRPHPQPQYQYQPPQMINQYPNVLGPGGSVYAQFYRPVVNHNFEWMNNNMGMVNNTGMPGNGTYVTYGNDPTAAQDAYAHTTRYDDCSYITGTSDNVGYDGGAFGGSQFGTDERLDCGGFDASGFHSGGFDDSGFDAGGFDY